MRERERVSRQREREREWFLSRFPMNSSLQYRKIREFELCSKPFSKRLSSSSSWGKMVTRQCNRKGMYPTRDALKSYEGSVFHLPGAGHREFHHFPRSYQVMSIERGAQYRPSTPYYRSNGYTRIFWYPSLSIISPFFIIFIFSPFLFHCFHSVHAQHHGSIGMNETKIFTISSDFYIIFLYLIRILHLFSFYLHRIL